MRTNIEIDDALMRKAMRASGQKTKRATVEAGLRLLVRMNDQTRILKLFGAFPDFENVRETAKQAAGSR